MANLPTSLSCILLLYLVFTPSTFTSNIIYVPPAQISQIYPFVYSNTIITSCTSTLYQHNGLSKESISTLYSVNASNINPISGNNNSTKQDYLVSVPCSCKDVNDTIGYFYETLYTLQPNDTFANVSFDFYSGEVWKIGGEESEYKAGEVVTMFLLCGCLGSNNMVTTYTVQPNDTLTSIADLLSSQVGDILSLNPYLNSTTGFIDVGWLLYVPMNKN